MAATQNLSQLALPHNSPVPGHGVVTLFGYGIQVRVERGHLVLTDGIATDRRRFRLPRVDHGLRRLVVIGADGNVSLAALRWLADQNAAFVMLDRDGSVLATTGPVRPSDAKLRRAQALAFQSETGLHIAKELISRKLQGQEQIARTRLLNNEVGDSIAECRNAVLHAMRLDEVRFQESRGAAEYWSAFRDLAITFPKNEESRAPEHWCVFGNRKSVLSGSQRLAVNPANAMLNYLYAVLESESRLALASLGLDPGLGFIHLDTTARDSLACDAMEAVRWQVDNYVLDWIFRPLSRKWFFEERNGNCRLMADFATRLAETAPAFGRSVASVAEWIASQLWATTRKRTHNSLPPTRLTQSNKRGSKTVTGAPKLTIPAAPQNLCRGCGMAIGPDSLHCRKCATQNSTVLFQRVARLGRDAARSPGARAKHSASRRRHAAECSAWNPASQPSWLTKDFFTKQVQPRLAELSPVSIRKSLRVSRWYANHIRRGYIPHPRHWLALAGLAGIVSS